MTCCGRWFHTVGAAWENERSVKTSLVLSFCVISFCYRNVNDVTEHGIWWHQSDSSVLSWSKSCKQWLQPCTVFSTWPATSVGRQGSKLRGRSVWFLLRFARRSSERVEVCSDSQLTCRTGLSCSSPTVHRSLSRQWPLPLLPQCDSGCEMEVGELADVVDVYIERQCAINSYSEASDTGRRGR